MAPLSAASGAKKIFKFVSGVLNGAFGDECLPDVDAEVRSFLCAAPNGLTFANACDALAVAVTDGFVPDQGQNVLRTLLTKQQTIHASSSLHLALGIPLPEPFVRSAQRLFQLVSGVMNHALAEEDADSYSESIDMWVPRLGQSSFRHACDALALAMKAGMIPEQSMELLKVLFKTCTVDIGHGLACMIQTASVELDTDEQSVGEQSDTSAELMQEPNGGSGDDSCDKPRMDRGESANRLFKCLVEFKPTIGSELLADLRLWLGVAAKVSFWDLCNALALAVEQQYVPEQACEVLRSLAEQMREKGLTSESSLAVVLKLDFDRVDRRIAARRIFAHVKNALQGLPDAKGCSSADIAVWCRGEPQQECSLSCACAALAAVIRAGEIPDKPLDELCELMYTFPEHELDGSPLEIALHPRLCPMCKVNACRAKQCDCKGSGVKGCDACKGSGKFTQRCRGCNGSGQGRTKRYCPGCNGSGRYPLGDCRVCQGNGRTPCVVCDTAPAVGGPRPFCFNCTSKALDAVKKAEGERRSNVGGFSRNTGPPPQGVSIERCNRAEMTRLQNLWLERESQQMPGGGRACNGQVVAAWKVDNPLLAYQFKASRDAFKAAQHRDMDKLEGFHGTHPDNVISICSSGFDAGRRAGQVYGAGEYFAKNPHVSVGYCRGGEYMLVCRLSLGTPSSTPENKDGDHIWVPQNGYYVIKHPNQVLVQYIVKFKSDQCYGQSVSQSLERNLSAPYTTKPPPQPKTVPNPRPCVMSRPSTSALWMGLMSPHIPEDNLKVAVRNFLAKHAPQYPIQKIQILRTHFSKAHVFLEREMPKEVVRRLNQEPFVADDTTSKLCVDSFYGSPEQKCPKWIAGYCRGQNLRFTGPCWCHHEPRPTEGAKYTLTTIPLDGAKGDEIKSKFMASAPFHNGMPKLIGIKQIKNEKLSACHEDYRRWLTDKHGEEPSVQELYHGTNNNILDLLYTHGLQPPSDMEPSDKCPVSGGKGLCTSLCTNSCKYCTRKHEWGRCHMYGLGIYLGDMSQKSNRYVSQPKAGRYKMIVCSVLGKSYEVDGFLKGDRIMHDVHDVRALTDDDMDAMIEPCQPCKAPEKGAGATIVGVDGSRWGYVVGEEHHCWRLSSGRIARKNTEGVKWNWCKDDVMMADTMETAPEKSDLMFVKGLGSRTRVGFSVVNSEYIAFHPHQCLPLYEIEYQLD
jgi:hypothetical protein